MITEYFRYSLPISGCNSSELTKFAGRKSVSVERFGYVARLIDGGDDEFLRASGAKLSQMAAHKRFRHSIYRRSLKGLQRDYRFLEAQALAGMQDHGASIDEIVKTRWTIKLEIARLEWAGVMYRFGIPAGNRVAEILANLQNAVRLPATVAASTAWGS